MKKLIIPLLILMLLPMIIATQDIGSVQQNKCIMLKQTCSNCTYVNLSSVSVANNPEYLLLGEYSMTKTGTEYNYSFCDTQTISDDYSYCVHGDIDGIDTPACISFSVTPSGLSGTLGFYFILLIIIGSLIILGFTMKDAWFIMVGGIISMLVGLYSINYGIAGMRDMFITWGIGLFEIFMGGYLAIKAGLEIMSE